MQECAKLLLAAGTDVNAQFLTNPGISLDYSINKATGVYHTLSGALFPLNRKVLTLSLDMCGEFPTLARSKNVEYIVMFFQ